MSITFSCSRCSQRYQVDEGLAGKKVKCKGCGEVMRIPGPRPPAPPPAAKPDRPSSGPKRPSQKPAPKEELVPSWLEEDEGGFEVEAPSLPPAVRPQAKPSSGRDPVSGRSSRLDPATAKYLAIGGAAVVGLIVIVVVCTAFFGGSKSRKAAVAAHAQVVEEGLAALDTLSDIFIRIEDPDSARSKAPEAEIVARSLVDLAERAAKLPTLPPDEAGRLAAKYRAQTNASLRKWKQAYNHVKALSGVPEALQGVIDQIPASGT